HNICRIAKVTASGRHARMNAGMAGPEVRSTGKLHHYRRLAFKPDEVQAQVLNTNGERVLLNCTRQHGKSTVTAAKAVYHAQTQPGSLTPVVSRSARQSGEFLRKCFATKSWMVRECLKLSVQLDGHNLPWK